MNKDEQERMKHLLRDSLGPAEEPAGRDLWPRMLQRLDAAPAVVPWFDWALLAGLAALLLVFPASIPLLLYYL